MASRIMLIDDDEMFNFLNRHFFKKSGMFEEILVFDSGIHALEYLKENQKDLEKLPQLISLDLNMPIMNGFDFLEAIQEVNLSLVNNIKIMILSSSLEELDRQKSAAYPMVIDFVCKPLDMDKLNLTLKKV